MSEAKLDPYAKPGITAEPWPTGEGDSEADKICRNCKHWNGWIDVLGRGDSPGPCDLLENEADHRPAWITVVTDYPEFIENVVVNTRADFGCNQWELGE